MSDDDERDEQHGFYLNDDGAIHDYDQLKQEAIDLLRSAESFVVVCSTEDDQLIVTSCVKGAFPPYFHIVAAKEAAILAEKSTLGLRQLLEDVPPDDGADDVSS